MVAYYDDLRVGKQEIKRCPEPGCAYSSNNKSDLKDHINSRHIHFPCIKCEVCFERFYTRRNYNRHRKSKHKIELLNACAENGKVRKVREEEESDSHHSRLITPAVNESTIFNGTPKEGYVLMVNHYKRMKVCKQDIIKCPEKNCQYTCNNKTDLKGHINSRHIHYRVIECELCNEWFYTQKAAHSHKKNRHKDAPCTILSNVSNSGSVSFDDEEDEEEEEQVSGAGAKSGLEKIPEREETFNFFLNSNGGDQENHQVTQLGQLNLPINPITQMNQMNLMNGEFKVLKPNPTGEFKPLQQVPSIEKYEVGNENFENEALDFESDTFEFESEAFDYEKVEEEKQKQPKFNHCQYERPTYYELNANFDANDPVWWNVR